MHENNVFSEQVLAEGHALVRQYASEESCK
jgi:hypothetical protein